MSPVMRRLVWAEMSDEERASLCERGLRDIFDDDLRASIGGLISDVGARGDAAVCDALARFDAVTVEPAGLRVTAEEIEGARVTPAVERALLEAIARLRTYNEHLLGRATDWMIEMDDGLLAGEKVTPVESVGLFVPGGKASYPSVACQLGVPAVVAGVGRIVMCVPPVPGRGGEVDPAVLLVCRILGISEVYRVNGPAGIAAMGFGTATIPRVGKIVGPGSPAVTLAQVEMQRHGVATMMLLGPTESIILADGTADPVRLAADLLIEAEHGTDSSVLFVTDSSRLVEAVESEIGSQIGGLHPVRAEAARASLGINGGAVLVTDLAAAVEVVNLYAPEHLQVAVDSGAEEAVLSGLHHAGEILLGQDTPFSAANYVIGCPASLPTSGFARFSSGITVDAFLKRTAVARASEEALRRMAPSITALADHEGFDAHGAAIRRRFG